MKTKTLIIISSFMLLLTSCQTSNKEIIEPPVEENETPLLLEPTGEVNITIENETFMVDFRFDFICEQLRIFEVLTDEFAKLKTRNDLINSYTTLRPVFLPSFSSLWPDNGERIFARVEYMLAQECFSNYCDSKTRKEILMLVVEKQREKWSDYERDRYISPFCTQKTGVFLMSVILVKEWEQTIKFIDRATLQQALLCLNNADSIREDFSNLIVECSEKFLANSK